MAELSEAAVAAIHSGFPGCEEMTDEEQADLQAQADELTDVTQDGGMVIECVREDGERFGIARVLDGFSASYEVDGVTLVTEVRPTAYEAFLAGQVQQLAERAMVAQGYPAGYRPEGFEA